MPGIDTLVHDSPRNHHHRVAGRTDRPRRALAMNLPGPSPAAIQTHLYSSFLEAKTADVTLHIRGTWDAIYRLHRVVLIQAGFFSSLFTAGFEESSPKRGAGPDEIKVVFDDQNITRAAFEICISRLYGGGPPLHVSPSIIPTPSQPLTPDFPMSSPKAQTPEGQHPATPRFLLSLLATSIYLSIPSTASQALNFILRSIGPRTVIEYLNFALGKPISALGNDEPDAAVGLEHIAQVVDQCSPWVIETTKGGPAGPDALGSSTDSEDDMTDALVLGSSSSSSNDGEPRAPEPTFHYGAISDKIGEACACWLTRWGPDIFDYEEKRTSLPASRSPTSSGISHELSMPVIWARGGLNAKWVSALISSDALFVRGEWERYEFAKSVIEFRRRDGVDNSEEGEWRKMFSHGIYYANMSTEDMITISQDVSPTTGRLYVPLSTLQAALWSQSVLRQQILSTPAPSNSPKDKDLGVTQTSADILVRLSTLDPSDNEQEAQRRYYPIPTDSSSRLGETGGFLQATTMDQLFDFVIEGPDSKPTNPPRFRTSESNFFGFSSERHTSSSCVSSDATGKSRWSPYPPLRFAVEFWDVNSLKEKSRLHSHTVWYAGSLFNVYVQVVRKKGVQLGVYLHRQSSIDPLPPSSAPPSPSINRTDFQQYPTITPQPSSISASPSSPTTLTPSRGTTPLPLTSPQASSPKPITATAHSSSTRVVPSQPYRDPRGYISAYFSISCASATGSSSTTFTSAPDVFAVSQSWGWKSSSLWMDVWTPVTVLDEEVVGEAGNDVSFRATVVLGLV